MGGLLRMIENKANGTPVTGKADADAFLTANPEGLLYGALYDQQMRAELAFIGAVRLSERMGGLDAAAIARMDPDAFCELFRRSPGVHRFGAMMAERTQKLAAYMLANWDGKVANTWADDPSDTVLLDRFGRFPGYGPSKAGVLIEALELFGHRPLKELPGLQ